MFCFHSFFLIGSREFLSFSFSVHFNCMDVWILRWGFEWWDACWSLSRSSHCWFKLSIHLIATFSIRKIIRSVCVCVCLLLLWEFDRLLSVLLVFPPRGIGFTFPFLYYLQFCFLFDFFFKFYFQWNIMNMHALSFLINRQ